MQPTDTAPAPSARYAPQTPWGPVEAVLVTVVVVAFSAGLSLAPLLLLTKAEAGLPTALVIASVLIAQLVMGLGAWLLAGTRGGQRMAALALGPMQVSTGQAALAIAAMFAATTAYQAFRHVVLGHDIFADMLAMKPMFVWPYWPLSLVAIAIVAPLAEELLFRGFLLSAFASTWQRFWAGVIIGTLIWTALHLQYALPALVLVALMGLIFCLLLRWSGSLRLPIIAHMLNNTVAGLYLIVFVP